jgi:predicted dienelactone hydrolase
MKIILPSCKVESMKSNLRSAGMGIPLLLALFSTTPAASNSSKPDFSGPDFSGPGPLAVEVTDFPDLKDSDGTVSPKPERFRIFRRRTANPGVSSGREVPIKVHIPQSGGPYPIVIISHGAGGNRNTHFGHASHLASHGYAVLCVEHPGSNTDRMKSTLRILNNLRLMIHDSNEVLARPKDLGFAINQAAEWNRTHPSFRGRLDLNHIGVLGHSFGAYTVMAIAGMRPALDWLKPPIPPGSGLGPSLTDERVKCGVAMSPQGPGEPFFLRESYGSQKIPLLGISGTKDQQQNGSPAIARLESFQLWPEMKGKSAFLWLKNASHLDFTDSSGTGETGLPSATRSDVQPVIRAAMLIFFNQCLKDTKTPTQALAIDLLNRHVRGPIEILELLRK